MLLASWWVTHIKYRKLVCKTTNVKKTIYKMITLVQIYTYARKYTLEYFVFSSSYLIWQNPISKDFPYLSQRSIQCGFVNLYEYLLIQDYGIDKKLSYTLHLQAELGFSTSINQQVTHYSFRDFSGSPCVIGRLTRIIVIYRRSLLAGWFISGPGNFWRLGLVSY